jgi:GT2 family glycosyltransferase
MELSVVILNFNASVFLELCVESVTRALKNIQGEILVVDNDSSDDSIDRLASRFKAVRILKQDKNIGFSRGNNIGVAQARGKYICLINPDVIVGQMVFESCLGFYRGVQVGDNYAFAKAKKPPALLGIKLIDGAGKYLPESKRCTPKPWIALKKLLGFSSSYYDLRIDQNQDGRAEILVGAFMFCMKHVYQRLGGLDERYFMYGEDIDISYTALQAGYQNYYLGTQTAIHFKGESTIKDRVYRDRFFGAMALFYKKHYRYGKMLGTILQSILPTLSRKKQSIAGSQNHLPIVVITNDLNYKPIWSGKTIQFEELNESTTRDSKLVFDISTIAIDRIIEFMQRNVAGNHQIRFLTTDRSAYAGSDSSNERGEVVKLQ